MFDRIREAWRNRFRPVHQSVEAWERATFWFKVACIFVALAALKYLLGV